MIGKGASKGKKPTKQKTIPNQTNKKNHNRKLEGKK